MGLALDLQQYIEELENINAECMRPREDGGPCPQCFERAVTIRRLRLILKHEAPQHKAGA